MINALKNKTFRKYGPLVVIGALLLFIGFQLGMAFKAWEIRKAIGDAFKPFTENASDKDPIKSTTPKPKKDLNQIVDLNLIGKSFEKGDFYDYIALPVKIYNNSNSDIRGVSGTLIIYDIFGKEIRKITLSYDEEGGLPPFTVTGYQPYMNYNQFMDEDVKLNTTDFKNLKYKWITEKIIYQDGSEESNN